MDHYRPAKFVDVIEEMSKEVAKILESISITQNERTKSVSR